MKHTRLPLSLPRLALAFAVALRAQTSPAAGPWSMHSVRLFGVSPQSADARK